MKKPWQFVFLIAGVYVLVAVLVASSAHACYTGWEREVSLQRAERVSKLTHIVWPKDARAHAWQERVSCESKGRKYARNGQYLGLTQMGQREREVTGWGWKMIRQLRASKRWHKMGGTWACPLG